jgi:phospholipase C
LGGTSQAAPCDYVLPGQVPPSDPAAPPGELGFAFDRSGYRVPAVFVSPWVEPGSVYNLEYRHTSLIATLRKSWGLGEPFTQRDASACTFEHVFSLATPRDPQTWATVNARPVPGWTMDPEQVGQALSSLGKGIAPAIITRAQQMGVPLPAELDDPGADFRPRLIVSVLRGVAGDFFPLLAGDAKDRP